MIRRCWGLASVLLAGQGCAVASVGASRYLAHGGADLTGYEVAREAPLAGPFDLRTLAVLRPAGGEETGWMAGGGVDLTVLAGDPRSPYLVGGVQAGIGTRDQPRSWGSWSLGLGSQLLRVGPLGVRAEARYRRLTADSREGLEIGVRIGRGWVARSTGSAASAAPGAAPPRTLVPLGSAASAPTGGAAATRAAVVGIATEVMGTPYRWGGTSADGFDCSGLIQYAYREVGITLPRRSADQGMAGVAVAKELSALLPGDILTFVTGSGGVVSHVGLYLGDGRFIHSATGGVQVSTLSASDSYGRWWWQRWAGARRVVP